MIQSFFKDFEEVIVVIISASLLSLVYLLASRVWKISHPWLRVLTPYWVVCYWTARKERNLALRRLFKFSVLWVIYLPIIAHIVARSLIPDSSLAVNFGIGQVPILIEEKVFNIYPPWLFHVKESSLTTLSFACWWLWMNTICSLIVFFQFKVVDRTKDLIEAISKYEPFKRATRIGVKRISSNVYLIESDAFVRHEGLLEVQESIENSLRVFISEINKVAAGVFEIRLGALKIGIDSEGRQVSMVKWEELKLLPIAVRCWPRIYFMLNPKKRFGFSVQVLMKKPNPAVRHTIPVAFNQHEVYVNLLQEPMWGFVGGTNSGKTSAVQATCASVALADPHTLFTFVDFVKNGNQYRICESDPRLVYSKDRPKNMTLAEWQRKLPRLPNVFLVDTAELFVRFVHELEREINYRAIVLAANFNKQSLYDLEDPGKTKIKPLDQFDPPRIYRHLVTVDDWVVIKDQYGNHEEVSRAVAKLLGMVSYARYVKVHIFFISQKATIIDYFPHGARDQIWWLGFALPSNQSEYVLKTKVNIPDAMGVVGYRRGGTQNSVGIACTPYIRPEKFALTLAITAEQLEMTKWGKENRDRMIAFRTFCESEGGREIMERVSISQNRLLSIPIESESTSKFNDNGKNGVQEIEIPEERRTTRLVKTKT